MKRTAIIIASLLMTLTAGAQTVNVHKADGVIVTYPSSEVDYIDFSAKGELQYESYLACPDANHPHMIDLGLPSGTKWACCNVGASAPEQCGNYYAWGETQPKIRYDAATYSFYTGQDTNNDGRIDEGFSIVDIGSDISGTSYDAATVNWGEPWRIPTREQCRELIKSCSSELTTQNDVKGRKFTGPNGGTIFLPAAGYRYGWVLASKNFYGYYWSSPLSENDPSYACSLYFTSGIPNVEYYSRYLGSTVRPVR